ncbi:MAG: hypothetical protein KGJ01_02740 [Patescibacteria group bacterium]|nr:hypothetical protein [Patescibacteria group bacterium]
MPRKSIKNIKPVLADIRHKGDKYKSPPGKPQISKLARLKPRGEIEIARESDARKERTRKLRVLGAALVSILFVLLISWIAGKALAYESLSKRYSASKENLLQILNPQSSSSTLQLSAPSGNAGSGFPFIQQFNSAVSYVNNLGNSVVNFSDGINYVNRNWLTDFFGGNGSDLLNALSSVKTDLGTIISANKELVSGSSPLFNDSGTQSADLESNLLLFRNGADGLYSLLNSTSSHILIVFSDPTSSLRPAGGSIVSYADLYISGGEEKSITVESITVPDSKISEKILPPPELQGLAGGWNAGQANWFFDFPESAAKIISFMDASGMYSGSGEKFSGVVFVNSQSLKSIISAVDPGLLPKSGSTVNAQYLKKALPEVLSEVASSTPAVQRDFFGTIDGGLSSKDIMMFFNDSRIQSFVSSLGYDGGVYSLPYNFSGDYLGVANMTPTPAMSGTVLSEHVILKSQIDQSGMINDDLTIENSYHNSASWYHDFRRTLIKVFTLPSSALIGADGMSGSVFGDLRQYRAGYTADPDLSAIENSETTTGVSGVSEEVESGFKTYNAWLNGYVGEQDSLHMNYVSGSVVVASGQKLSFVFDKQSGVDQTLDYLIQAPLGYGWKEAPGESSVYSYHASNLSPRTIISLTLVKTQ